VELWSFRSEPLTSKNEQKGDNAEASLPSERYTIFHALFQDLKEKDEKRKLR